MKIAYIAHIRFPSERAHAVQIVHMANACASIGHEVELFVSTRSTAITQTPEEYYGTPFLFKLRRVPIVDIVARIHRFPKMIHPILYNIERLLFVISFIWCQRGRATDVFYCRDEIILGCLSFLYPSKKMIFESHEGKSNFCARRLLRRAYTVAISEGIKARYVSLGFDGTHIMVAHDAIDDSFLKIPLSRHEARRKLELSDQKPIAMYIGGLDTWKGVDTLFEAAAYIPDVQVVIIGGAPEEVATLRIRYPHIRFLGSRPYRDLPDNQQAADILIIPNTAKNKLSAEYTSPLKLFAHMASRIPIVLSDIPSLRAMLDETSANFFPPDNVEALARAITDALRDPIAAQQKARIAYEKVLQHTWRNRAVTILRNAELFNGR